MDHEHYQLMMSAIVEQAKRNVEPVLKQMVIDLGVEDIEVAVKFAEERALVMVQDEVDRLAEAWGMNA